MSAPFDPVGEPYDPNPQLTYNPYDGAPPVPPPYPAYDLTARQRPGQVAVAAAFGHVTAALLLAAAFVLLVGAFYLGAWDSALRADNSPVATQLVLGAVANLVAAGLLLAGGLLLTGRRTAGRPLLGSGAAICLAEAAFWLARLPEAGIAVWALIFAGLALTALCLAFGGAVSQWLRA